MSGKLSDSPWFWLLMFGSAAVASLAVIGPKHIRRQERLVRMQATRERLLSGPIQPAAGQPATGQPTGGLDASQSLTGDSAHFVAIQPPVSLRPLMVFLASALFVAALIAGWMQMRTPPAGADQPPNEVQG